MSAKSDFINRNVIYRAKHLSVPIAYTERRVIISSI